MVSGGGAPGRWLGLESGALADGLVPLEALPPPMRTQREEGIWEPGGRPNQTPPAGTLTLGPSLQTEKYFPVHSTPGLLGRSEPPGFDMEVPLPSDSDSPSWAKLRAQFWGLAEPLTPSPHGSHLRPGSGAPRGQAAGLGWLGPSGQRFSQNCDQRKPPPAFQQTSC